MSNAIKKPFIALPLLFGMSITQAGTQASGIDADNPGLVERGQLVYKRFCSFCHGKNLEGQTDWHKPKPDGKMPAPPHNESGHTWHHADIVLFNITKYGLVPPYAPADYQSDMPGYKDTLMDNDIWAVLSYIKSRWPSEHRQFQENVNKDYKP